VIELEDRELGNLDRQARMVDIPNGSWESVGGVVGVGVGVVVEGESVGGVEGGVIMLGDGNPRVEPETECNVSQASTKLSISNVVTKLIEPSVTDRSVTIDMSELSEWESVSDVGSTSIVVVISSVGRETISESMQDGVGIGASVCLLVILILRVLGLFKPSTRSNLVHSSSATSPAGVGGVVVHDDDSKAS
jgi:hypothetical protein